ncbi:hypothetical protein ZIOFF_049281 [Zingiber officinale]|uniref:Sugar phosphate transporter domain-containing protein n=1 Tax=Zingiber officinale TaxID=94328 RepID=A0A8J5FSG6_ZINOF|nr:hypothetical protein ZIOFF_049281 [Zingiber officinale]
MDATTPSRRTSRDEVKVIGEFYLLCSIKQPYLHIISLVLMLLLYPSSRALQMISSTCFLYTMRRWRIISFTNGEAHKSGLVPPQTVLLTLPLSLAYLLYMLATMECVRGVNVPMYTMLRRTTVVFTMSVEYLMTRQKYSFPIVGSVAMIVFGAIVAGARDLSFDVYGYIMVFIANMTTAIYLATINRTSKTSGLNSFGLMWCHGIVCGPILLFWTYIHGDLELTMNFPYLHSLGFQVSFFQHNEIFLLHL